MLFSCEFDKGSQSFKTQSKKLKIPFKSTQKKFYGQLKVPRVEDRSVTRKAKKASIPFRGGGRRSGLMFSALDYRANGPGSSPGQGHCVVFLGKTLYSHIASLHPGV